MSKTITLLVSSSKRHSVKTKLILNGHMYARVDGNLMADEPEKNPELDEIFSGVNVKKVNWRWPSGRAFRDVQGVSELAILGLLRDRGVPVDFVTEYENVQVPEENENTPEWSGRENHLEIIMEVDDAHYTKLCKKHGDIAVA